MIGPAGGGAEIAARLEPIPALYARIVRTYAGWARSLIPLAIVVFVPLGLAHALLADLDLSALEGGVAVAGTASAVLLLTATGLLGGVFYAGAVAVSLTHPHDDHPPSLREIAGALAYKRLLVVDVLYGLLVAVGLVAFALPGLLVFVYLGLAAPVVEIERRTVRDALARSIRLVRGKFWTVLAVLVPIELLSDSLTNIVTVLSHNILGESLWTDWLIDTATNVAFTPFYAVAAVLLTVELIAEKDDDGPRLHSQPPSR